MSGKLAHRLFLDANVIFSAAYRVDSALLRLWTLGSAVNLLSSPYAIEEARRNLTDGAAHSRLITLLAAVTTVADAPVGSTPYGIVLPAKDGPILCAAIAAKATHLLTGDRAHFGSYFGEMVGGMLVERPGDYLRREHPARS